MMIELLLDLGQLSVTAWAVLMLCAGVIGMFAGMCLRDWR